jgi:hypothetical protein
MVVTDKSKDWFWVKKANLRRYMLLVKKLGANLA